MPTRITDKCTDNLCKFTKVGIEYAVSLIANDSLFLIVSYCLQLSFAFSHINMYCFL